MKHLVPEWPKCCIKLFILLLPALTVFPADAQVTFAPQVTYTIGNSPEGMTKGDFNGDNKEDLAVANISDNNVSILLGGGDGTFQLQATSIASSGASNLTAGDFNGDAKPDLAVISRTGNNVSIFLGNGDGTFQVQTTYAVGARPQTIITGDFNGDGSSDLVVTNYISDNISILLGNGDGSFQPQVNYATRRNPYGVVAGNFNGDGNQDLAVTNFDTGSASIYLGNGDGTFQTMDSYEAGFAAAALVAGDFDGDGMQDLAVANQDINSLSILLGNGNSSFRAPFSYELNSSVHSINIGDFNRDGIEDIVAATWTNHIDVFIGKGDGTFEPQVSFATGGSFPRSVISSDFDGDGMQDVAITNFFTDNVSILRNTTTALPVSLVSFSANALAGNSVAIKWETAQEMQNSHFVIERSKDLTAFETVTEIRDVAGNSDSLNSYLAVDHSPYQGTSYYRLLQYDYDGTRMASRIVSVVLRSQDYTLYPNPVRNQFFRISVDEPVTAQIKAYSASGKVIAFTRRADNAQTVIITPSESLASGTYLITVEERATKRSYSLVVQ